jgi:hypothetical protein
VGGTEKNTQTPVSISSLWTGIRKHMFKIRRRLATHYVVTLCDGVMVKLNLSLCLTKHRAVKTQEEDTLILNSHIRAIHAPVALPPRKQSSVHVRQEAGKGSRSSLDTVKTKVSAPAGSPASDVQTVAY